jgi:hypothetical protein
MQTIAGINYETLAKQLIPEGVDLSLPHFFFEESGPTMHTLRFCVPKRRRVTKFIYDMVSQWLIPGRRLNLPQVFSVDYKDLTVGAIMVETGCHPITFSLLEHELTMGALSQYHASRILELKVLTVSEKMSRVQELLTDFMCRFPEYFDHDLFATFHRFLHATTDEFRSSREVRYLARVVSVVYLLQKSLHHRVESDPTQRHMKLKLLQTRVHDILGVRHSLGIFVGLNFLRENEVFAKKHLLRAIRDEIQDVHVEQDVTFTYAESSLQFLYLEVEKETGEAFTLEEIRTLRDELPGNLRGRIEHLLRPVFMPRNEEEVMRRVITLASQLKFKRDLPQVVINFDEQTDREIVFTVIFARVLHEKSLPIAKLLSGVGQIEKVRKMGKIRRRFAKEVTIVRIALPVSAFIRDDETVDIARARQQVLFDIQSSVGEVRDFNGGMLSKQVEALSRLRALLGPIAEENALLLENFFHSLFPVEFRSVLDPGPLKELFLLLIRQLERDDSKETQVVDTDEALVILIPDAARKEEILESVSSAHTLSLDLIMLQFQGYDRVFLGYIYFSPDQEKREELLRQII